MQGFTAIDAVVAVVILLSAILAYSRGLVREAMAIAGWIGAAVVAYLLAPLAEPLVKEIPVIGEFLRDSCELSIIAAFAAVFAIGLVVASLFTPLLSSAVQNSAFGGLDQGLGFMFGVLRGAVLVAVAFLVYDRAIADAAVPMVEDSRSAQIFASVEDSLNANIPADAPGWIVTRYEELVNTCGLPVTPVNPDAAATAPATQLAPDDAASPAPVN